MKKEIHVLYNVENFLMLRSPRRVVAGTLLLESSCASVTGVASLKQLLKHVTAVASRATVGGRGGAASSA